MNVLAAALSVVVFLFTFWLFGVVSSAAAVVATGKHSIDVMKDQLLSEEEKEKQIRRASIKMLRAFFSILLRGVAALVVSLLPLAAFELLGLASFQAVLDLMTGWKFIAVTTLLITLGYFVIRKFEFGK